jgi:hypothetical protein
MFRKLVLLVCFILALSACENTKPNIVIVSPAHGSQFREGETIAVQSTATDARGVARVELLVDGAVVRLDTAPTPQTTFTLIQTWQAVVGTHTLMVRAYNTSGAISEPAAVSIVVSAMGAGMVTPTVSAQQTPSVATPLPPRTIASLGGCERPVVKLQVQPASIVEGESARIAWYVQDARLVTLSGGTFANKPEPIEGAEQVNPTTTTTYTLHVESSVGNCDAQVTLVVVPRATPPPTLGQATPLPTTPAPQTGCLGTPNIESFTASPMTITAGGTSTLSWGTVTNADAVEIDQGIGGVVTPGSRVVSPATTTTYTLTARCGANTATRQVTIVVGAAFAVTEARMTVASRTYNGTCPTTFDIEGEIRTNGEGTVTYRWERSTIVGGVGSTTQGPIQSVNFIGSARVRTVEDADWHVTTSGTYRVRLIIVTPNALSTNQVTFTVNCLATPTPTFTPTHTRTPTPLPRVTGATIRVPPDNYSGRCPYLFRFWADITVDRAGTIKYRWHRSDGFVGPEHELTFGSAGTRTIEGEWQITKDGSYRVRIEFTQPSGVASGWSPPHNVDCR